MSYIYGITDIKYKPKQKKKRHALTSDVPPVKYRTHDLLARRPKYNHDEWPIDFRATAASLVELSICAVDKLPLPSVYEWDDKAIRLWICRYGYPQYMRTFRVNLIWGRKLLLLDADALSAMNIKDFDHIKHITYGIRMLFHFELTKFSHSISLPDEKPNELYLLWHTQTGVNYDAFRRSDLYIRMQLIRERSKNLDHWDLLELWLRRERERKFKELIGGTPRFNMYICPKEPVVGPSHAPPHHKTDCICPNCMPPCDCLWTPRDTCLPWNLHCLSGTGKCRYRMKEGHCTKCMMPCECHWLSRYYLTGTVLRCLKTSFPQKFAPAFDSDNIIDVPTELLNKWTRFSL
ncbi:uncharacterized protein LOC6574265 [Drosophila mojavensis]|uniref:SAM domain-containing protein n=1 Tax=Drosophila mojavensis TaxID=7230 RepID=B4KB77_DROMO|nr:uncharacterized protein LOC6574265 [Drosophila mojavensis]EDW15781.1 uncharacterized protein Dmoj_GI22590 [Drosophila mojavensis]